MARTAVYAVFQHASPPDVAVADRDVPGPHGPIPVRIYGPAGGADDAALVVYLHGGGFVTGNLDTHDAICRELAVATGALEDLTQRRRRPEGSR